MGYSRRKPVEPRYKIHPIWAGIGFLMVIIVPIISWAAASETVTFAKAQAWPLMRNFPTYLVLPDILYMIPGMRNIVAIANLPAILTFFLLFLFVFTGIVSLIYAFVYRLVGPPRYSPQDEPAPRIKTKKYKR